MINIMFALASCVPEDTKIDDRDDFTGNWLCQEDGTISGQSTYNVSITKSSTDSVTIYISNFYGLGNQYSATATVDGNSMTIPAQLVNNFNVSGSGTLSGSQINLNYTASAGGSDIVSAIYSR